MTDLQLLGVNKTLAAEIDVLMSNAEQAKLRLQLLVQWWEEFESNQTEVSSWLDEADTGLALILARHQSPHPPRVSPIDLLQEIKVCACHVTPTIVM